jgi:hypothetical protein
MNKKGSAGIILIVAIALLAGGLLYFTPSIKAKLGSDKKGVNPTQMDGSNTDSASAKIYSESEVLANLKADWQSVQASITFRPSYHNQTENAGKIWRYPTAVQFIGNNNILVRFEDDNNAHAAVFNFNGKGFKLLALFRNQAEFTLSDWQEIVNKYGDSHYVNGDPAYTISTYATDLVRNGKIVTFPSLTSVSENIFVKAY